MIGSAEKVSHRCYTRQVPTQRRRHAITETPPVQAALAQLREELGDDRVDLSEIVILGAQRKVQLLREARDSRAALRHQLAERIRARDIPVDPVAAEEVRRHGWARP